MANTQVALVSREQLNRPDLSPVGLNLDDLVGQLNSGFANLGLWTQVPFLTGQFKGNAAMTWTVQQSAVTNYSMLLGKTLIVHLMALGTTVGGTPNTTLTCLLPNGLTAATAAGGSYSYRDNNSYGTGIWEVTTGGTVLNFYRVDKSNWSASSGATDVRATAIVQVS